MECRCFRIFPIASQGVTQVKRGKWCLAGLLVFLLYLITQHFTSKMLDTSIFMDFNDDVPDDLQNSVNCAALFAGDRIEVKKAFKYMKSHPKIVRDDMFYFNLAQNCSGLKKRGYISDGITQEEEEFPMAFSILLYKEVEQAERLLRLIYRPQNTYCIHVDLDAAETVHKAMQAVADCFPNVFIASKLERVVYAGFSRLQAELNCMSDALRFNSAWRYYINLASQMMPLKTNREMVKILKIYNGANDIEGILNLNRSWWRFLLYFPQRYYFKSKPVPNGDKQTMQFYFQLLSDPPHQLRKIKGSAYGTFSRDFVEYILDNEMARDLLDWARDVYSPDEHYWAILNHLHENPQLQTPGGYKGVADQKPWLSTFASWCNRDPCYSGRCVRGVCIFGVEDLPQLITRREFTANKFYLDFQYLAMDCIEEWLHNKTFGHSDEIDYEYYKKLPFILK